MRQGWLSMSAFDTGFRSALLGSILALAACVGDRPVSTLRPTSMLGLRFEATVPQHFDYTCGASSVATVLTFYWNHATTEDEAVGALRQRYSLDEIAKRRETGLSFDDLIFIIERLGFAAQGAKISIGELARLQGPVIVQLSNPKFQHFVVLRRVGSEVFYVADPIVGNYPMSADQFRREFTGYALAIWLPTAPLPVDTRLMNPHDGISVPNTLQRIIDVPSLAPHPII